MDRHAGETYREVAEAAWRWVLDQVRWQDGPWIPTTVTDPEMTEAPWDRDGMHSGVAGLVYVLAEIRLGRPWTVLEQALARGIAERLRSSIPSQADCTLFEGLVSSIGALIALGTPGAEGAVARLAELAEPDGWPQTALPERYARGARINDLTLGTAGVLLGSLWARRHGVTGATAVAEHAAAVLLAEAEHQPAGTSWGMVPPRFEDTSRMPQMPNLSHGTAGVATSLALAATDLERPDLLDAARSGADYLVSIGDLSGDAFVVPRYLPRDWNDQDEFTYGWCHGTAGTSLLFLALDRAGMPEVAGDPPLTWHRRCLHGIRSSGLPARLHPGFWDNDGRCCGTAGVGEVFLDSWHRAGDGEDLDFALRLADTLVERADRQDASAFWRFVEHRAAQPLLPPGVGWMQGAAGIAAFLFHASRVAGDRPDAGAVPRMDSWWAL